LNAVEIEEAISQLADQPFEPQGFPYAFLEAFGNKETTIKRLRAGASNKSGHEDAHGAEAESHDRQSESEVHPRDRWYGF
jgi:hypothetical protein